jgi:hypothetical protein
MIQLTDTIARLMKSRDAVRIAQAGEITQEVLVVHPRADAALVLHLATEMIINNDKHRRQPVF